MLIRALRDDEVARVGAVLGLARLHQGDGRYLVAWDGDDPVGHLHLTTTTPPQVQDVEVRPAHRRRGVATSLLATAEATCAARGDDRVRVEVSVHNDGARTLYEGLGYHDAGLAPRRVTGTIEVRTGTIEVDDTLLMLEKHLGG